MKTRLLRLSCHLPILAATLLFCGLSRSADAQTISNPGFEQELADWDGRRDSDMSSANAEAAHTGHFGLRVTDGNPQKASQLESLAIEVVPEQKYEVSFWARTVSGEGGVAVSLRFFDEKKKSLQKKPASVIAKQSPEWKKFTVTGLAPAGAVGLIIVIHSLAPETVTADLDDFELRAIQ